MKPVLRQPFPRSVARARRVQESLRGRVESRDRLGDVRRVAGVDVSYDRGSPILFTSIVVLAADRLDVLEVVGGRYRATFPYVPGYLSFRELPSVKHVMAKLRSPVDLIVCDGQGLAHPRRFGLACHLGVLFDVPTIGCAKSPLCGTFREPAWRRGSHRPIRDGADVIGEVVRTRDGVKPVFVSVGHRVSLETARRWVLHLAPHTRLPETTRHAHGEVNRLRRESRARGG